jgi:hypothetical protein
MENLIECLQQCSIGCTDKMPLTGRTRMPRNAPRPSRSLPMTPEFAPAL